MIDRKRCPECDSTDLHVHGDVAAKGGYGPDLLPGASGIFVYAKMRAIVCRGCGLIRLYASQDALRKIDGDHGWQRLL